MTLIKPEMYGPVTGDCTATFQAMFDDLINFVEIDPGATYQFICRAEIYLDARSYRLDGPLVLRPDGFGGAASGLSIQGAGKGMTEIVTTHNQPMFDVDNCWKNIRMSGIRFRSDHAAGKFMYSYSTGNGQDYVFNNCEWRGTWEYGLGLDGNNCNSELTWNNCAMHGSYSTGFLYSGMTPTEAQQDQFLNYWFNDCKVEFEWGNFLRMVKGGSIKVDGGSYIIASTNPDGTTKSRFFHLGNGAYHYDSVCNLAVRDVRFELRNSLAQLIYADHWNGQILFDHIDDCANGYQSHSPSLIAHEYVNAHSVRYLACNLVGKHKYTKTFNNGLHKVVYDQCWRKNNTTEATFIVKAGTFSAQINPLHRDDVNNIPEG